MPATCTVVQNSEDRWGKTRVLAIDIALSGVYPLGGYTIEMQQFGFKGGIFGGIIPITSIAVGVLPQPNIGTGKLQFFVSGVAGSQFQEVTAGQDVTGATYRALIFGY